MTYTIRPIDRGRGHHRAGIGASAAGWRSSRRVRGNDNSGHHALLDELNSLLQPSWIAVS